MKTRYILKNLMLVERNKEWLSSGIPLNQKLLYYPAFWSSYTRLVVSKDKHIRYFGRTFYYDNPATPFNLQNYPFEITHKVLRHMSITPKYVMDIGANIGQFPLTVAAVVPGVHVDALEPNSEVFKILEKNIKSYPNVKAYNVGVGKPGKNDKMYFEPTRSGTGSLIPENAGDKEHIKEIPIKLVDDVPSVTKRKQYDLITIDVEGYEMDVVKCLKGVKTRYLFMEVSTQSRSKRYNHSELFDNVREALGDFDIVYTLGHSSLSTPTFDILLEFVDNKNSKKK
jgi:FkbM family methyltransferase